MSIILTISAGKGSVCVSNDVLKIKVYRYTISQRYENIDSFPSSLAFRGIKDHVVCPTTILTIYCHCSYNFAYCHKNSVGGSMRLIFLKE